MRSELVCKATKDIWAIDQIALQTILTHADIAISGARQQRMPKVSGAVAVMPLHGMISQRASIWSELFGGTATEQFGAAFIRAINDERIKAVVMDVDSPGGITAGIEELADIVYRGAQIKPVAAVSNSTMASGAYWIASQVGPSRLMASPGSDTGSIGVFRMHEDLSAAMEAEGVKVDFMAVPDFKTEGNPYQPMSEEGRAHNMEQVQQTYDSFVAHVARGRGVSAKQVREGFGKGRTFHASQAATMGLVDRVATLAQVLAEFGVGTKATAEAVQLDAAAAKELCQAWIDGIHEVLIDRPRLSASESRRRLSQSLDTRW